MPSAPVDTARMSSGSRQPSNIRPILLLFRAEFQMHTSVQGRATYQTMYHDNSTRLERTDPCLHRKVWATWLGPGVGSNNIVANAVARALVVAIVIHINTIQHVGACSARQVLRVAWWHRALYVHVTGQGVKHLPLGSSESVIWRVVLVTLER